jgi:hypothetical protein
MSTGNTFNHAITPQVVTIHIGKLGNLPATNVEDFNVICIIRHQNHSDGAITNLGTIRELELNPSKMLGSFRNSIDGIARNPKAHEAIGADLVQDGFSSEHGGGGHGFDCRG